MTVRQIAKQLRACFIRGNTCYIAGNGGSAQMANHFATELVHEGLRAQSLTNDPILLTALANDFSFEDIFVKQLKALAKKGDLFVGLSTSGKSRNLLNAYKWCKDSELEYIDFPRKGITPRCQEYQLKLLHQIWEILKKN